MTMVRILPGCLLAWYPAADADLCSCRELHVPGDVEAQTVSARVEGIS